MNINTQNRETYFLLYVDNELTLQDREAVEKFVLDNPAYISEFNAIKQTVLKEEEVIFEDKALLYRLPEMEATLPKFVKQNLYREETKVITGYFSSSRIIRITAIAALLVLFIGYPFYTNKSLDSNNKNNNDLVISQNKQATTSPLNKANLISDNNNNLNTNASVIVNAQKNVVINNHPLLTKGKASLIEQQITLPTEGSPNQKQMVAETETAFNMLNIEKEILPATESTAHTNSEISSANMTSAAVEETESYNNINTDDHDRSLYIANFEIDGDKLRGFSRRINAFFKRNKNEKQ